MAIHGDLIPDKLTSWEMTATPSATTQSIPDRHLQNDYAPCVIGLFCSGLARAGTIKGEMLMLPRSLTTSGEANFYAVAIQPMSVNRLAHLLKVFLNDAWA